MAPTGNRIDDGFSTVIEFANTPNVQFWEKSLKPPGIAGGGANETTTMRNTRWRTNAPKKLLTLTESTITVAYDPALYNTIVAQLQVNQLCTITFADGSTLAFWGWIDEFEPDDVQEGEQPTATVTIIPSNQDDTPQEVAPVYTAPPPP